MFDIEDLIAREVLDSRGYPTLEVDCLLSGGALGRAAVPSGAANRRAARELRDGDDRYSGRGVLQAADAVFDEIYRALEGLDARDQVLVDRTLIELDGSAEKSRLGANTTLGVSLAVARAAAETAGLPFYAYLGGPMATLLPVPIMGALAGRRAAGPGLDVEGLAFVPMGFETFSESLRAGVECYHTLGRLLEHRGLGTAVSDDGAYRAEIASSRDGLELLVQAIDAAGYEPGGQVGLAVDVAASHLVEGSNGHGTSYAFPGEGRGGLYVHDLIALYREWLESFPILSIEDGLAEVDLEGWVVLTGELGEDVQLVGDELFASNPQLIADGIAEGLANAVVMKVDQVGTLTEALKGVEMAKINSYVNILGARPGETEDTALADLAVATQAGQVKAGAPCRGERVAKYNRLLRIEEELEDAASFPGTTAFPRWEY